jgi:hypothetical protein
MADYYPLIARAIEGLSDRSPEMRAAVYERARSALIGQLANLDPPLAPENIEAERVSLDAAIARIEREQGPVKDSEQEQEPEQEPEKELEKVPEAASAPANPPHEPARPGALAPARAARPAAPLAPLRDSPPPRDRPREERGRDDTGRQDRGREPVRPLLVPRGDAARPAAPAAPSPGTASALAENPRPRALSPPSQTGRPRPPAAVVPFGDRPSGSPPAGPSPEWVKSGEPLPPPGLPPASAPNGLASSRTDPADSRPHETPVAAQGEDSASRQAGIDGELTELLPEPDTEQPVRPRIDSRSPVADRTGRGRSMALAAVLALVVASIGVAAWFLRDRPEDLTRPGPVTQSTETPADGTKLSERVGGGPAPAPAPGVAPAPTARVDTSVAQRAVLYEEDPSNPQVPKATGGRVTWKLDAVNAGQGQPLQSAVRATVEIPESGFTLNLLVRRNLDPTLPASHTVELTFTTRPGEPPRAVRDVGLLQFKPEMGGRGTPVAGLPVPVRDNLFLIGLSNLPADIERNTELMQRRNWIDLPVRSASGQRAIVSFEKGPAGDQVIRDAFQSWQ